MNVFSSAISAPLSPEELASSRAAAARCARSLRPLLSRRAWRGESGGHAGAGAGSSIDFLDHRPYVPGDDPRHVDWAARARSGQTLIKLTREEVSPRLELVLDNSASMFLSSAKRARSLELLWFCAESALAMEAAPRLFLADSPDRDLPLEAVRPPGWQPVPAAGSSPDPARFPFRAASLRILISDLLFPAPPEIFLSAWLRGGGEGSVFVPFDPTESTPDWDGNLELVDCENGALRRQRVNPRIREKYQQAYVRHFQAWREACRKYRVPFSRIPTDQPLTSALLGEPLRAGQVEPWG